MKKITANTSNQRRNTIVRLHIAKKLSVLTHNHMSLVLMLCNSSALFFGSLLLKEYTSPIDYGAFALIVTAMSASQVFGTLGAEQVLMRLAVSGRKPLIEKRTITLVAVNTTIFTGVTYIGTALYLTPRESAVIALLMLSVIVLKVLGAYYRLSGQFFMSQLSQGWWRYFIVLWCISAIMCPYNNIIDILLIGILWNMLGILFSGLYCGRPPLVRRATNRDIFKYLSGYFLSILVIAALSYGDRLIIAKLIGVKAVGEYFYAATILVLPFTVMANYIGFRKLFDYKKHYSTFACKRDMLMTALWSFIAISLYGILLKLLSATTSWININVGVIIIVLLSITALVRLIYAHLSAATSAHGSKQAIFMINSISLISILIACVTIISFPGSLELIVAALTSIWIVRCVASYWYIPRLT